MINSFWNDGTNNLYNGVTIGLPKQVVRKAIKILTALDATDNLLALRTLGIRAEKKEGKVKKGARRYPNKWHCIDIDYH